MERPHRKSEGKISKPAEFDFHQERWQRMAEKDAMRSAIQRYLSKNSPDRTPEDFMEEEAERDNADFDRRRSEEYVEKWQPHLQKVLDNLKKAPKWHGDPEKVEGGTLLLVLGGALRGTASTGQLLGMREAGIDTDRFKAVIGISAGSGPAAYAVAGQPERAASLFMNECTTEAFLNLKRVNKVLDTEVIAREMRSGPKALDTDAIKASETGLYVVAKNKRTKKSEVINMKTAKPDMVAATEASSAIPPFRDQVEVNGEQYIDGGFDKVPLEDIITRFKPKDVLVLPNTPFGYMDALKYNPRERAMVWSASRLNDLGSANSMATIEAFFHTKGRFLEFLEDVEKTHGVHIGIMWPPDSDLGTLNNDPDVIKRGVLEAARSTIDEFGAPQPREIKLFEGDSNIIDERPQRRAA